MSALCWAYFDGCTKDWSPVYSRSADSPLEIPKTILGAMSWGGSTFSPSQDYKSAVVVHLSNTASKWYISPQSTITWRFRAAQTDTIQTYNFRSAYHPSRNSLRTSANAAAPAPSWPRRVTHALAWRYSVSSAGCAGLPWDSASFKTR